MDETAHSLPFLRESLLFLVFAGVLIPLLQRFRINQILGFLAVGVVVGRACCAGRLVWDARAEELA